MQRKLFVEDALANRKIGICCFFDKVKNFCSTWRQKKSWRFVVSIRARARNLVLTKSLKLPNLRKKLCVSKVKKNTFFSVWQFIYEFVDKTTPHYARPSAKHWLFNFERTAAWNWSMAKSKSNASLSSMPLKTRFWELPTFKSLPHWACALSTWTRVISTPSMSKLDHSSLTLNEPIDVGITWNNEQMNLKNFNRKIKFFFDIHMQNRSTHFFFFLREKPTIKFETLLKNMDTRTDRYSNSEHVLATYLAHVVRELTPGHSIKSPFLIVASYHEDMTPFTNAIILAMRYCAYPFTLTPDETKALSIPSMFDLVLENVKNRLERGYLSFHRENVNYMLQFDTEFFLPALWIHEREKKQECLSKLVKVPLGFQSVWDRASSLKQYNDSIQHWITQQANRSFWALFWRSYQYSNRRETPWSGQETHGSAIF